MLQTCGYASQACFQKVLTELDGVLYDLKLMDDAQHKRYTGVSNQLILQNFAVLVRSGVPFTVRVPLIPTVTDTEKNLRALCEFLRHHGVTYAELMPYHAMTGSKYSLCGRVYAPSFDESIAPNPRTELFAAHGITVKIL
jgi:pyruvate formate lyase activating enzyme